MSFGTWDNANATPSSSRPTGSTINIGQWSKSRLCTTPFYSLAYTTEIRWNRRRRWSVTSVAGVKNGRTVRPRRSRLECDTRWLSRRGFGSGSDRRWAAVYAALGGGGQRKRTRNDATRPECVNAALPVPTACSWKPVTRHRRTVGVPGRAVVAGRGSSGNVRYEIFSPVARVRL